MKYVPKICLDFKGIFLDLSYRLPVCPNSLYISHLVLPAGIFLQYPAYPLLLPALTNQHIWICATRVLFRLLSMVREINGTNQ